MMKTVARIPPLPRTEWDDAARDIFAMGEGEEGRRNGSKYNVMSVLANHPALAKSWLNFNQALTRDATVPARLREIAILRVAWRHRSDYEWTQHVMLGRRIGLDDADFDAVRAGVGRAEWSEVERLALNAVDQLVDGAQIEQATWDGLASEFDRRQMMELLFFIGSYVSLALIFNAVGVQLDD